jgi:hypothetical protein
MSGKLNKKFKHNDTFFFDSQAYYVHVILKCVNIYLYLNCLFDYNKSIIIKRRAKDQTHV